MRWFVTGCLALVVLLGATQVGAAEFWLTSDQDGAKEEWIELGIDNGPTNVYAFLDQQGLGGPVTDIKMWSAIDDTGVVELTDLRVIDGVPTAEDMTPIEAVYGASNLVNRLEPFAFAVLELTPLGLGESGFSTMPMTSNPGAIAIALDPNILVRQVIAVGEPKTVQLIAVLGLVFACCAANMWR